MGVPSGVVTFLFTDIEGSTRLLEELGHEYSQVLETHHAILSDAAATSDGHIFSREGDSFAIAFLHPDQAIAAALDAQIRLQQYVGPKGSRLRVRMGIHTGTAELTSIGYVGLSLHQAARVMAAAHGGQVLISDAAHGLSSPSFLDVRLADLGLHRLRDLGTPIRLYQLTHAAISDRFPEVHSLSSVANNIPIYRNTFVGRELDLTTLASRISTPGVTTLVGPGGVGKTRLAMHAAAEATERFRDGIWVADLGRISAPSSLRTTLLAALGLRPDAGHDLEQRLLDSLRESQMLVLLDNCEHLALEVSSLLRDVLQTEIRSHILATSRRRLGVEGEAVHLVRPLGVPEATDLHINRAFQAESVKLFCDRARQINENFELTKRNVPDVIEICRRLDGMPLALELAAARVSALSARQIADRLDDGFHLLTTDTAGRPAHHRTLTATLDWSHSLLNTNERRVFRMLSVFESSFSIDAAEVVCSRAPRRGQPVARILASLVDHSLVVMDASEEGEARFRLLTKVREYAYMRLCQAGEQDELWRRLVEYLITLLRDSTLTGPRQPENLRQLDLEEDTWRSALEWAVRQAGSLELGRKLTLLLCKYWFLREKATEAAHWLASIDSASSVDALVRLWRGTFAFYSGELESADQWLSEALNSLTPHEDPGEVAHAQAYLSLIAQRLGDSDRAAELAKQGLQVSLNAEDAPITARLHMQMGVIAHDLGMFNQAHDNYLKAREVLRTTEDPHLLAGVLNNMAVLMQDQGNFDAAEPHYREVLTLLEKLGDESRRSVVLVNLAQIEHLRGNLSEAKHLIERALSGIRSPDGDRVRLAALTYAGAIACDRMDLDSAIGLLTEAFDLSIKLKDSRTRSEVIEELARTFLARREHERATRLLGFATGLRVAIQYPVIPALAARNEAAKAVAHSFLGSEAFYAHYLHGLQAASSAPLTSIYELTTGRSPEPLPELGPSDLPTDRLG